MTDNIHRVTFKIRHDECDAYGHLNNAHYLRYMQEAAFSASAAVGLDHADYIERDRVWLIRATSLEYLRPLTAGDRIEIETWIEGLRRATARRRYVIHKLGTDTIAGRGFSDWVFLKRSTGAPVAISPEVVQVFFPQGEAPKSPRWTTLRPPARPEEVFVTRRTVEWRDIDPMRHLNNAVYLSYAEECAIELAQAYGWCMQRWMEYGVAFVARQNQVEYLCPARMGDEIRIETWLTSIRAASGTRFYRYERAADGQTLARLNTRWVLVDLQSGQPKRLPDEFRERIAPNLAPA
jgi:acyl-CoA thioester hydrolase